MQPYYVEPALKEFSPFTLTTRLIAYLAALENNNAQGVYQIASENVTNKQIAKAIGRLLSIRAETVSPEIAKEKFAAMSGFLAINN